MNKCLKGALALLLAAAIGFGIVGCKQQKTQIDLEKFPLVYADSDGLKAIWDGEKEATLITKDFHSYINPESKVQAASDGKIYFVSTASRKDTTGTLCAYDVEKKESETVREGVYSFKVSHDGECLIFSDGTGGIFKFDSAHEKKNDYVPIQSKGVISVLDISADGKYVLYAEMISSTNYYSLTIAKTDFEQTDETAKWSAKQKFANKDLDKGPVVITKNFKEIVGAADDYSVIYFTTAQKDTETKKTVISLGAFQQLKTAVSLAKGDYNSYFIDEKGNILYSKTVKNDKGVNDIVTDKYAKKDAALKKASADAKQWKAKQARDDIRKKIKTYLQNISCTAFYTFSASAEKPEQVHKLYGRLTACGADASISTAFFGTTLFDFEAAEKPDISKVKMAYKLFDAIKTRQISAITAEDVKALTIDKSEYNSGDCFVDTAAKKIHVIMDFDYLKAKVGKLYVADYSEKGFGEATLISEKATKTAHFNSGDDNYFVIGDGSLVKNDEKSVVLKNYGFSSDEPTIPVAFTSIATGEKNQYGQDVKEEIAYYISGEKAHKMGEMYIYKNIVTKGDMFVYFTDYDYEKSAGNAVLFNGKTFIGLGDSVVAVFDFNQ